MRAAFGQEIRRLGRRGGVLACLIAILAACTPHTAPSSLPEEAGPGVSATFTPGVIPTRAALPPTWTPTYTPRPPTATPIPTVTPTPTATPTLDAAGLCGALELLWRPAQDDILSANAVVTLGWLFPVAEAGVRLRVVHESGAAVQADVPGPAPAIVQIPSYALAGPGRYSWSLTPRDPAGHLLTHCAVRGGFRLGLPANPTPE